jgi:L-amino acid N-acyltransferase YncA
VSVASVKDRRLETAATESIVLRDAIEANFPAIVEIHNAAVASGISTGQLKPVTVERCR